MATLPRAGIPVSIPHGRAPGFGFPIGKSLPAATERWVVVYARQPNRFYEAIEILFEGERFGIEDFRKLASRRLESHAGRLRPIPGRHMYFAPTIELWSTISENHGYAVADPSRPQAQITPEMREIREGSLTSGVLARISLYTGDKLPAGILLPVFVRAELTLEPRPGPRSRWIRFDEYQDNRDRQSQPPAAIVTEFAEWVEQLAAESRCGSFVFRSGMSFGDPVEWWGDGNLRRTRHEGIDFAEGRQPGGEMGRIPEGTPVRVMAEGKVVAVLDDFLGKTVVVRHPAIVRPDGTVFYTLYSHIQPDSGLSGPVAKRQRLGRVAKAKATGAPAHLHLTSAWIRRTIGSGDITMDRISPGYAPVVLIDFNGLLAGMVRDSKFGIRD